MGCYHCGASVELANFSHDDKAFCCHGCISVYSILKDHDLGTYYGLESQPGSKPISTQEHEWNYLLNEEIQNSFIQYSNGNRKIVHLFLPNIHCSSCIWLLENLSKINKGVISSEVNFVKKTAIINYDSNQLTLKELAIFLTKIGYRPQFKNESSKSVNPSKKTILKIGVAGFCFGNVMLLSFPEYLSDHGGLAQFEKFFNYLILGLSIPVLLYCAQSYLKSAFVGLRNKHLNVDLPISIGIIALYGKSLFNILSESGPGYMDSFIGFIFFLLIGEWFKQRTFEALSFERDYKAYLPLAISRIGISEEIVPIYEIQTGDTILIRSNEVIPVDSKILAGHSQVDYSFVTGESELFEKTVGDLMYAGGKHQGATVKLQVIKPVNQSYLTSLWENDAFKKDSTDSSSKTDSKFSQYFIIGVLGIAIGTGIVWSFIDPNRIPSILTSILIVACPCAFALASPFTFGSTSRAFGRNLFYVKNTHVVEQLSDVTDVIFDKTGTITSRKDTNVSWYGPDLSEEEQRSVMSLTYNSSHPKSQAICQSYSQYSPEIIKVSSFEEKIGKGVQGVISNHTYRLGSSSFIKSNATPSGSVVLEIDGEVKGYYAISSSFRNNLSEVIKSLDFDLHVLTGDNDKDLDQLQALFGIDTKMKFNQLPIDKLNYVRDLQEADKKVLMIGDGLNDAGALQQSNVGITITDNIYNFSPASDGILDASNFHQIPSFISMSKWSKTVLIGAYIFSILYNIVGLYFAVTDQLTPLVAAILMPLSSISIIAATTLTVNWLSKRVFTN